MATEVAVHEGGLNGEVFGEQSVGQNLATAIHGGATSAAAVGGVIPGGTNPLGYVASGGLTGTLKAGRYFVPSSNPAYGGFQLTLPADTVLTHDTASSSQARTDRIIAEVAAVGTSASFKKFRILKGDAVSGAPAPTVNWTTVNGAATDLGVGAWVVLHDVTIAASATSFAQSAVTDRRTYAAAAGGTQTVKDYATGATMAEGRRFYATAERRFGGINGGGAYLDPRGTVVVASTSAIAGAGLAEGETFYLNDTDRFGYMRASGQYTILSQGVVSVPTIDDAVSFAVGTGFYSVADGRFGLVTASNGPEYYIQGTVRQQTDTHYTLLTSTDWTIPSGTAKEVLRVNFAPTSRDALVRFKATAVIKVNSASYGTVSFALLGATTQVRDFNSYGLANVLDFPMGDLTVRSTYPGADPSTYLVGVVTVNTGGGQPAVECRRVDYTWTEVS
jgi:hypothetical protein